MIRTLIVSAAMVLLSVSPLGAQYFGRNKVEYHDFDFRVGSPGTELEFAL